MISGELDILKDWCYEAVSTAFIILVKWQSKKKKSQKGWGCLRPDIFQHVCCLGFHPLHCKDR